ncbi:RNA polymerase subunit sigma-70 [Amycolatopsis suaedae]|uniref:RNA polymerase sigma factor n=1 Tax=Amycolatopsis suaedae TaxID=2510978 RepID=A0A4Q7J844_9PSEU|nr:RNA polymerase subunit sigma-70 [Amycolatopsis suaedae]RZQ63377.1 sigma-70 family RNA polymerase sigma factor [Amycolatopsis suaedae]
MDTFRELIEPHRDELRLHCYRILGSLADAEDVLQETMVAAWQGLDGFAGRSTLRTWLYRIATNRCLNALRAGRRRPAEPLPPFDPPEPSRRGEVTWLEPYPDGPEASYEAKETVELAFVAALQRLPPRQAAILVLRDVLGFSTAEVAEMLDTSATAVKGALQRARATVRQRPAVTAEPPALARRFAEAFTAGDVDGLVSLLTDDAWLNMPPAPHEYHGRAAIAEFFTVFFDWCGARRFRLVPTCANAQPAFGCYLAQPGEPVAYPAGLLVLSPRDERLGAVTWFLHEGLLARFGLPSEVS